MVLSALRVAIQLYPFQLPRAGLFHYLPDVPDDSCKFQAKRGMKYVAYTSRQDYIIKSLFWFGDFEPWVITVLKHLIRPNEIFCDIGANIGDTTLQLLPYIEPSGQIYCFEPVPALSTCLRKNLQANKVSCATLVPKALSNQAGKLKITSPTGQPGMSRITEDVSTDLLDQETIEVEVVTFDTWLNDNYISKVAVCKIDVEGHELKVFEGMQNALCAGRIGGIVFERHTLCDSSDPVVQILQTCHYRIFRIYKGLFRTRLVELGTLSSLRETKDYVAVLRNSEFERRLSKLIDAKDNNLKT